MCQSRANTQSFTKTDIAWSRISPSVSTSKQSHVCHKHVPATTLLPETPTSLELEIPYSPHRHPPTIGSLHPYHPTTTQQTNKMSPSPTQAVPSVRSRHRRHTAQQVKLDSTNDWIASDALIPSTCPIKAVAKIITTETAMGKISSPNTTQPNSRACTARCALQNGSALSMTCGQRYARDRKE
jgi:hypothetical protein